MTKLATSLALVVLSLSGCAWLQAQQADRLVSTLEPIGPEIRKQCPALPEGEQREKCFLAADKAEQAYRATQEAAEAVEAFRELARRK